MKDKILLAVIILAVGSLTATIIFSRNLNTAQNELTRERYIRITKEEELEKASLKIKSLQSDTTSSQNQVQNIQLLLEQEKRANSKLQTELEKVSKLKEVLERELKNALVTQSSTAQPPAATEPAGATGP